MDDDIEHVKIYTDFQFETDTDVKSFSNPVSIGQVWGIHGDKPTTQTKWEKLVQIEVDKSMANDRGEYFPFMQIPHAQNAYKPGTDMRPHLLDPTSEKYMLVDTGACVCVAKIGL